LATIPKFVAKIDNEN